jgi:hypothetical protein
MTMEATSKAASDRGTCAATNVMAVYAARQPIALSSLVRLARLKSLALGTARSLA